MILVSDNDAYNRMYDFLGQEHRYFIGRDLVSGYALIDGNLMEDVYDHLNRSGERYDKVFEYSL